MTCSLAVENGTCWHERGDAECPPDPWADTPPPDPERYRRLLAAIPDEPPF